MKQINLIKLFISCPNDIKDEIDSIRLIVDDINKTFGHQNSYSLECLNWSTDTYTQIGDDAQDVINTQLDPQYDILVGIFWQKIGTPTKRDKSGTIEEINRAIANSSKEFLIYFKNTPPESLNDLDLDQLAKVKSFKNDLSKKGVLYKEFNSTKIFESLFRIHLTNLISEKILKEKKLSDSLEPINKSDKYAAISAAINQVESNENNPLIELDIFELSENLLASFNSITNSLESMTSALTDISNKMTKKTKELDMLLHVKDNRLRMQKNQILVNLFADELVDFNKRMESEKEILSEYFLEIGPKYSQIMLIGDTYKNKEEVNLRESLLSYRDSVEFATKQNVILLKAIGNWPPSTSKFNKSKRETEVILKDITKIFLEGLKLLDEALEN